MPEIFRPKKQNSKRKSNTLILEKSKGAIEFSAPPLIPSVGKLQLSVPPSFLALDADGFLYTKWHWGGVL